MKYVQIAFILSIWFCQFTKCLQKQIYIIIYIVNDLGILKSKILVWNFRIWKGNAICNFATMRNKDTTHVVAILQDGPHNLHLLVFMIPLYNPFPHCTRVVCVTKRLWQKWYVTSETGT